MASALDRALCGDEAKGPAVEECVERVQVPIHVVGRVRKGIGGRGARRKKRVTRLQGETGQRRAVLEKSPAPRCLHSHTSSCHPSTLSAIRKGPDGACVR